MEATACFSGRTALAPAPAQCRSHRPAARPLPRRARGALRVAAAMGIGFHGDSGLAAPQQDLWLPEQPDYGLTVKQMQVLGLTNDGSWAAKMPEVKAVSVGRWRRRCRGGGGFALLLCPSALHNAAGGGRGKQEQHPGRAAAAPAPAPLHPHAAVVANMHPLVSSNRRRRCGPRPSTWATA